jgi:hypothetical protein
MTFQKIILIIALVSLIFSLAVIGLLIKSASMNAKFPPETGKCPDYFKATLSKDGTLGCTNPHNLGSCGNDFTPEPGTNVSSIIANCKNARKCNLTWDGITNVQNNETGSPYC